MKPTSTLEIVRYIVAGIGALGIIVAVIITQF